MPIRVILDTNVYSRDKFRIGQGFKTLGNLCKSGRVEVLAPFIVMREFETQLDANATDAVAGFEKFGKRLAASPIPNDLRGELDGFLAKLKERRGEVIESHRADFLRWLDDCGAIKLELDGAHAVSAMQGYFSAAPPFQSVKSRADIPDAMIYQAVLEAASSGPVVFVCGDKNLTKAISAAPQVTHHNDLSEFLASKEVQDILTEQEEEALATEVLKQLKELSTTSPNQLDGFVSEYGGEGLAGTSFCSPSIPGDDREAHIYMFGSLDDVEFDWEIAVYHGDRTYVVPFSGNGEFNITYYVPKWDVAEIEDRGGSYSYHNDYVVEADEAALLSVRGTLRVKISDEFEAGDELSDAIDEMAIDSVEEPILAEDLD